MKKKFWTGRLKTILIIALVVAICAAVTLAISTGTSALENVVGTILSPIRAGVASIDRLAERYYNYMFRYESLAAENAEMEKQILAMQADVRDAEQLQRENEWLKALLQLSNEHEDYQFLTAYIISWDSSDYKSAFTIGKGTNAGLEEGMCAVTENGQVVGLVTKVGVNWATITTIMGSSLEMRGPDPGLLAQLALGGRNLGLHRLVRLYRRRSGHVPGGRHGDFAHELSADRCHRQKQRPGRHYRLDALPARAAAGLHHERQPRRDGRCKIRHARAVVRPRQARADRHHHAV